MIQKNIIAIRTDETKWFNTRVHDCSILEYISPID